jgi:hypothetical protein
MMLSNTKAPGSRRAPCCQVDYFVLPLLAAPPVPAAPLAPPVPAGLLAPAAPLAGPAPLLGPVPDGGLPVPAGGVVAPVLAPGVLPLPMPAPPVMTRHSFAERRPSLSLSSSLKRPLIEVSVDASSREMKPSRFLSSAWNEPLAPAAAEPDVVPAAEPVEDGAAGEVAPVALGVLCWLLDVLPALVLPPADVCAATGTAKAAATAAAIKVLYVIASLSLIKGLNGSLAMPVPAYPQASCRCRA